MPIFKKFNNFIDSVKYDAADLTPIPPNITYFETNRTILSPNAIEYMKHNTALNNNSTFKWYSLANHANPLLLRLCFLILILKKWKKQFY